MYSWLPVLLVYLSLYLYPDEHILKQEKKNKSLFSKHIAKYLVPLVHLH